MPTKLLLAAIILLAFVGSFMAKGRLVESPREEVAAARQPTRVISLAPSITETLFALGLGDRVVGVTRYCNYPPEARDKAGVGGFLDPNFEAILALRPDLVVLLVESAEMQAALERLGVDTLVVCHKNADDILASFAEIGRVCGVADRARQIVADIQTRLARIQRKTAGLPRPRVLVVIERTVGSGRLQDVYAAGGDGFFNKMITLAGGENACREQRAAFPVVSAEGILEMDPQVVLDMTPGLAQGKQDLARLLQDWQSVAQVEAVAKGRLHAVNQDYAFVPGPRFILLVEELARWIHPEVDWAGGGTAD